MPGTLHATALALLTVAAIIGAPPCLAQPGIVELEATGLVDAAGPDGVRAICNEVIYLIAVTPQSHVKVQGPASREFLAVGTPVAFTVPFDDKGKPTGPVADVSLFPRDPPGIQAEGAFGEPGAKPGRRRPAGNYRVVGVIKGLSPEGGFFVAAGKERLEITVTDDAKIVVDSANVALARKGDAITVTGRYQQPPNLQPGQPTPPLLAQAEELTITLATPLEPTGRKRPVKPKPPAKAPPKQAPAPEQPAE